MAEINKPTTRLETSTFTRLLDLTPIEKFDGLKFPTNSEVLRRYFYIKDHSSHSEKSRNIAKIIYHEIEYIYSKVPCKMKVKPSRIGVPKSSHHENIEYVYLSFLLEERI